MNICMIAIGNLDKPRNGYDLRCWMLIQRLIHEGNTVAVYQFNDREEVTTRDSISITSMAVGYSQPYTSALEKLIGFSPTRELKFPFEGYRKLRTLQSELTNFDVFYIEGCLLMGAFFFVKQLHRPLVLDTHCINKDVALKIKEKNKLSGSVRAAIWHVIEKNMLHRADKVIAISQHDKDFIEKHFGTAQEKLEIIPHVVNPAEAGLHDGEAERLRRRFGKGFDAVACYIGDLGAIQNVESERYIREELAPATPDVHYVVVGNNPRGLRSHANITYTGFVDTLDPYIVMADFCIAPMAIGSGVKTKVLDYLKYDKPVIATPVALEGIEPSERTRMCALEEFIDQVKTFQGAAA